MSEAARVAGAVFPSSISPQSMLARATASSFSSCTSSFCGATGELDAGMARLRPAYIRRGCHGSTDPQGRIACARPRCGRALLGRLRQRGLVDLLRPGRHRRLRPRPDAGRVRDRRPDLHGHRGHLRRGDRDVPGGRRLGELRAPRLQRAGQLHRGLGADAQLHHHGRDLGVLRAALPGRVLAVARELAGRHHRRRRR